MPTDKVLPSKISQRSAALREAHARMELLRTFKGSPARFWASFLQAIPPLVSGSDAAFIKRTPQGSWKIDAEWPSDSPSIARTASRRSDLDRLCQEADSRGVCTAAMAEGTLAAVRIHAGEILLVRLEPGADASEAVTRLRMTTAAPLLFQVTQSLEQAREDMARFAVSLDLITLLNLQTRFQAAAMQLCNEVAARFACDRVSLGWQRRGYVRLQAISHAERFEKKMALVGALELVMDEAFDQNEELVWPAIDGQTGVVRDHEAFARAQAANCCLLTIPLRLNGKAIGVLMLERGQPEFSEREMQTLRLLCDQVARRLDDLRRHDRWIGARAISAMRQQAAKLLGVEHTGAKLAVLGIIAALICICTIRLEYRVEAPFRLKTDSLAQVPAPYDGFIDEVTFRAGDAVKAGQTLVTLDTRDLLLEEAGAMAEQHRFLAEAQKAESDGDVAGMNIARAAASEAQARLELARYRLSKAKIAAPFDGFVVEGDLRERISAPVKQGEVLVKVAKLEAMYPEAALPERDLNEAHAGQTGEVAFASQPRVTFPVGIENVSPAAEVKENGNIFTVRTRFAGQPERWWRPGMSGVAKINAGRRPLIWIWTHRTIDYLRLKLWW
jgi:RND family efflux transporter MFP subunit